MDAAPLLKLFDHLEWADALVWNTALAQDLAVDDEYVIDSLFHIHLVQVAYLGIWRGDLGPLPERDDFATPADIRSSARAYYPAAREHLAALAPRELDAPLETPWTRFIEKEIGHPPAPATLRDTILQVVSHSGHHRAQVNRRLRELGAAPPAIDYIAWVWRGCPPADGGTS